MIDIEELEVRLKKAKIRAEKAKSALESASGEVARLETTLSVIREMSGSLAQPASIGGNLTQKQQIVINSLKYGQAYAMSPIDIYQLASAEKTFGGDVNYVRTTLWRMADKGFIGGANGTYWKYPESVQNDDPKTILDSDERRSDVGEVSTFNSWDDEGSDVPF
jgi:hypothetical protein